MELEKSSTPRYIRSSRKSKYTAGHGHGIGDTAPASGVTRARSSGTADKFGPAPIPKEPHSFASPASRARHPASSAVRPTTNHRHQAAAVARYRGGAPAELRRRPARAPLPPLAGRRRRRLGAAGAAALRQRP